MFIFKSLCLTPITRTHSWSCTAAQAPSGCTSCYSGGGVLEAGDALAWTACSPCKLFESMCRRSQSSLCSSHTYTREKISTYSCMPSLHVIRIIEHTILRCLGQGAGAPVSPSSPPVIQSTHRQTSPCTWFSCCCCCPRCHLSCKGPSHAFLHSSVCKTAPWLQILVRVTNGLEISFYGRLKIVGIY